MIPAARKFDAKKEVDTARAAPTSFLLPVFRGAFSVGGFSVDHTPAPPPVWQDATVEVKKGVNIVFTNSEATNGAAFNFRVSVSRGASGTGGYIEAISGAFQ